jgi:hypothetical protein
MNRRRWTATFYYDPPVFVPGQGLANDAAVHQLEAVSVLLGQALELLNREDRWVGMGYRHESLVSLPKGQPAVPRGARFRDPNPQSRSLRACSREGGEAAMQECADGSEC